MLNDTLLRIEGLLVANNMTKYQLAKKSNIPFSTLNSLFLKNNEPSIPTLKKICAGLGITLSEFFSNEDPSVYGMRTYLTKEEHLFIEAYRKVPERDRLNLYKMVDALKS